MSQEEKDFEIMSSLCVHVCIQCMHFSVLACVQISMCDVCVFVQCAVHL